MYSKVTKKLILECAKIIKEYGYWSDETREFLSNFTYEASCKIDNILRTEFTSRNAITNYHELLIKNNMLED